MDKAPDAFRTISEVADDLDIPQHVLRFWETRFTQIKPMKRSGGRRYYRPDDVDLLRGIRRLLYGEGYTIRGVQRILKEHGVKSVQGLVDGSAAVPSFGAEPRERISMRATRRPSSISVTTRRRARAHRHLRWRAPCRPRRPRRCPQAPPRANSTAPGSKPPSRT